MIEKRQPWNPFPLAALSVGRLHPDITPCAADILRYLTTRSNWKGEVWVGQRRIAEDIIRSKDYVTRGIRELEAAKLITTVGRKRADKQADKHLISASILSKEHQDILAKVTTKNPEEDANSNNPDLQDYSLQFDPILGSNDPDSPSNNPDRQDFRNPDSASNNPDRQDETLQFVPCRVTLNLADPGTPNQSINQSINKPSASPQAPPKKKKTAQAQGLEANEGQQQKQDQPQTREEEGWMEDVKLVFPHAGALGSWHRKMWFEVMDRIKVFMPLELRRDGRLIPVPNPIAFCKDMVAWNLSHITDEAMRIRGLKSLHNAVTKADPENGIMVQTLYHDEASCKKCVAKKKQQAKAGNGIAPLWDNKKQDDGTILHRLGRKPVTSMERDEVIGMLDKPKIRREYVLGFLVQDNCPECGGQDIGCECCVLTSDVLPPVAPAPLPECEFCGFRQDKCTCCDPASPLETSRPTGINP